MAEGVHLPSSVPIRATLGRSPFYRDHGRAELTANASRRDRVYDNDSKILQYLRHYNVTPSSSRVPPHGPEHAALYHFKRFITGQQPYSNVAHHLLPCEVFIPGQLFTDEEHEILRRVEYDVNNGKNIIFLPGFAQAVEVYRLKHGGRSGSEVWRSLGEPAQKEHQEQWRQRSLRYCNVHRLPCHIDFHRDYTALVKEDAKRIQPLLRGQLGKVCADWKPPQSIPGELFKLQDEYWDHVVRFGESRALGAGANNNDLIKLKPPRARKRPGVRR